jgi:hypothetical protein
MPKRHERRHTKLNALCNDDHHSLSREHAGASAPTDQSGTESEIDLMFSAVAPRTPRSDSFVFKAGALARVRNATFNLDGF